MIGRGDPNGVDLLVVEDLPHVLANARAVPRFDRQFARGLRAIGVDVADIGDPHVLARREQFQVIRSHAARTDDGDGELIIGSLGDPSKRRGSSQSDGTSQRLGNKLSAREIGHGGHLGAGRREEMRPRMRDAAARCKQRKLRPRWAEMIVQQRHLPVFIEDGVLDR